MSAHSKVSIAFTDGSVDVNKRSAFSRGAGAAVLVEGDCGSPPLLTNIRLVAQYSEGYDAVTNNTMELEGINVAVRHTDGNLDLWSDSQYALGVLFNKKWRPGQNRRLIEEIKMSLKGREVHHNHIPGHSKYFLNELADLVANRAVEKRRNIDFTLELAEGTHLGCLSCRHFPCEIPRERWKFVFEGLRSRVWYRCERIQHYAVFPSGSNRSNRPSFRQEYLGEFPEELNGREIQ